MKVECQDLFFKSNAKMNGTFMVWIKSYYLIIVLIGYKTFFWLVFKT
jgi:hypothetical protein